tara:strand:- start:109 stop:342 length:234 start_codon:yes stop_codon:yes gene_type:complete
VAQWLNWIEQPPPKGQVGGSNPPWVTKLKHHKKIKLCERYLPNTNNHILGISYLVFLDITIFNSMYFISHKSSDSGI